MVWMTSRRRPGVIVTPVGLWSDGCITSARAPLVRATASSASGRRPSASIATGTGFSPSMRAAVITPV